MSILRALGLKTSRLTDAASFSAFQAEQAVFVAQRSAYGYPRARVGRGREAIMFEKAFNEQMDICRWEGLAATLSDIMILAEYRLRPFAGSRSADLRDALCAVYDQCLDGQDVPPHRQDWDDAKQSFRLRIEELSLQPELPMVAVAQNSWDVMFHRLPIVKKIREWDKPQVYASFRLWMIRYVEDLDRALDAGAVAASLLSDTAVRET